MLNKYKFQNLEDAINFFALDTETGYFNHGFIQIEGSDWCLLCNDIRNKHLEYDKEIPSIINNNIYNNQSINQDASYAHLNNEDANFKSSIFKSKTKNTIAISSALIERLEDQFKYADNLCIICFSEELLNGNSYRLQCGHRFCNQCMKSYLENLINQAKVNDIKCLHPGCIEFINEKVVKDNVSKLAFEKYLKFTKRQTYLNNINNGLVPCVYPDCEEWISYKNGENPFLICEYGHRFCAKCKKDWHKPGSCEDVNFI